MGEAEGKTPKQAAQDGGVHPVVSMTIPNTSDKTVCLLPLQVTRGAGKPEHLKIKNAVPFSFLPSSPLELFKGTFSFCSLFLPALAPEA